MFATNRSGGVFFKAPARIYVKEWPCDALCRTPELLTTGFDSLATLFNIAFPFAGFHKSLRTSQETRAFYT